MIIGTTMMKLGGLAQYSPQFNRGGNAAIFTVEVLDAGSTPSFTIDVEHKNSDDVSWSNLATIGPVATPGLYDTGASGIKEQLRFKYTVGGANPYSAVHFNMLAPTWRPY